MIPLKTKFDTQTTVISHRRKERFSTSAGYLLRSSAIGDITRVLAIRASCFYISREQLGEARQACYQSTLISGTSFFGQWYFSSSGRSTEIVERSLQALLSSASRDFATRSRVLARLALLANNYREYSKQF